jgi:hypothetical protein
MPIVRTIPVCDRNGDEFTVYVVEDRRFLKKIRRMRLCTGELVEEFGDRLVVASTGETLAPVG